MIAISLVELTGYVVVAAYSVALNVMMPVPAANVLTVTVPRGQTAGLLSFTC